MDENDRLKEYTESLRPLPLSYLMWLAENLNKERSPARYEAILNLISEKQKPQLSPEEEAALQQDARVTQKVARIRKVYLLFVIIGAIAVVYGLFHQLGLRNLLEFLITLAVFTIIYFGLRRRKPWVIPLILISSAILSLTFISAFLRPAQNIIDIAPKIVDALASLFFIYQIFFFAKREVRMYFQEKGKVLF